MWAAGPREQSHSSPAALSPQCREALTTRQKLIAQDYKVSYSLAKSCKSDLKKYRCNVENLPRSREARLSYLLMCLESAVHRGESSFLFIFFHSFLDLSSCVSSFEYTCPCDSRVYGSRTLSWVLGGPQSCWRPFLLMALNSVFLYVPAFFFFLSFTSQIRIFIFKMLVAQQF